MSFRILYFYFFRLNSSQEKAFIRQICPEKLGTRSRNFFTLVVYVRNAVPKERGRLIIFT